MITGEIDRMEKIDLHLHSNFSDGLLSIQELIEKCIINGCKKIAITDHDVIVDYSEESRKHRIVIINGIEFSTDNKGMHILGYGLDNIDSVQNYLDDIGKENQEVCYKIIDLLYSDGFNISLESVLEYLKKMGFSIRYLNKKHIIKYLVYKEYVRKIDIYNAFNNPYGKYYLPMRELSKYEVLDLIKDNGGVAVLAHPSTLYFSDYELEQEVRLLMARGLDGIEVRNRSITKEQGKRYEKIANNLGILTTVGSDFHYSEYDRIGIYASEMIYENLEHRMRLSKKK